MAFLKPYRDIILFVVCLMAANYFWKYTVTGDEDATDVFWFGLNITMPFATLSEHIAGVVAWLVSLFRDTCTYIPPYSLRFDSGMAIRVVWSCTALKQSFIWLIIMLFARGAWKHKAWFIPFGWLCIYVFNILRIAAIALLTEFHPDRFELYHSYVFKYLFYFMLFMLWVWWVEKINPLSATADATEEE